MKKIWNVEVNGSAHAVELVHGYISGKRTIYVDGNKVQESRKLLDKGSSHPFQIDNQAFLIIIKPKGFSFTYELSAGTGAPNEDLTLEEKVYKRIGRDSSIKSSANWFYWIAGMSLLNTIINMSNGNWNFIIGLQITQLVDILAQEIGSNIFFVAAFIIDLLFAGVFIFIGVMANRRKKWAFIAGMVLYALDGLLILMFFDFISMAFHVYAIYSIYIGLRTLNRMGMEDNSRTDM